jgi:hypothetical protein
MIWNWIAIGLMMCFSHVAAASYGPVDRDPGIFGTMTSKYLAHDLGPDLMPREQVITNNPKEEQPVSVVTTMKRVPTAEDLSLRYWQDIFYERHHHGPQHLLLCASDNFLFEKYLTALVKVLHINPHCRITIVAPKEEHWALREQVKHYIIKLVKPHHEILRDLHIVEQPFKKETPDKKVERSSLLGDKYTGIFLACAQTEYSTIKGWLHNTRAMLYIPYTSNPETIMNKLYQAHFRTHEVLKTDFMICAATADHTSFPRGPIIPFHNPETITPKISIKRGIPAPNNNCPQCGPGGVHECGPGECAIL